MGGNAMAEYGVWRMLAHQRDQVLLELETWLNGLGLDRYAFVRELSDKSSFGDIDILYCGDLALSKLGSRPYKSNGGVLSTVFLSSFGLVQVDFIRTSPSAFDFAYEYYSFNDMGNLLGRIARMLGFTLGQGGLYYRHKDEHGQVHKLLVTTHWQTAMTLLGYGERPESLTWQGLIDYVCSGTYFCTRPFLLEQRSHKGRTRDRKRRSYCDFLTHLHQNRYIFVYDLGDDQLAEIRQSLFECVVELRQSISTEIETIQEQAALLVRARAKLNGNVVRDLTGLQGEQLGKLMAQLRQPGWELKFANASDEEVQQYVMASYASVVCTAQLA